jgi:hypothetical protein
MSPGVLWRAMVGLVEDGHEIMVVAGEARKSTLYLYSSASYYVREVHDV